MHSLDIEIVKMDSYHVDEVMIIEHLCFTVPWSKNAFMEELNNNKFARYIVAIVNGHVVGYAGMWKIVDEGHITNIAVHPEFRRCGIGSRLLEKLIEISRMEEIISMTLEVRKSNYTAQRLYSKYGFETGGMRKGYYSDNGEDALIMWKNNI